jgi:acetoin utilization deacetylase AcuC-like enzyme
MPGFFFDPLFLAHDTGEGHPECPERLHRIVRAVEASPRYEGTRDCPAADLDAIHRIHDPEYVLHVEATAGAGGGMLDGDTVVSLASYAAALGAAGAAIEAVRAVVRGELASAFCAVRPPGHHALPSRGMGFCVFNNVAVATAYARDVLGVKRTLIVDWDVHHGNGTQAVFEADPAVFYLSLHRYPHYPGTGKATDTGMGSVVNVPLEAGTDHETFLHALDGALTDIGSRFAPELIVISCGFDGLEGDLLGGFRLHPETFAAATAQVRAFSQQFGHSKIVSSLEGGYRLDQLGPCAPAHIDPLPERLRGSAAEPPSLGRVPDRPHYVCRFDVRELARRTPHDPHHFSSRPPDAGIGRPEDRDGGSARCGGEVGHARVVAEATRRCRAHGREHRQPRVHEPGGGDRLERPADRLVLSLRGADRDDDIESEFVPDRPRNRGEALGGPVLSARSAARVHEEKSPRSDAAGLEHLLGALTDVLGDRQTRHRRGELPAAPAEA